MSDLYSSLEINIPLSPVKSAPGDLEATRAEIAEKTAAAAAGQQLSLAPTASQQQQPYPPFLSPRASAAAVSLEPLALEAIVDYEGNEYPHAFAPTDDLKQYENFRQSISAGSGVSVSKYQRRRTLGGQYPLMYLYHQIENNPKSRLGKNAEEAALLEEAYQLVYGKWYVMKRSGNSNSSSSSSGATSPRSSYREDPPEFFVPPPPVDDIDMTGFVKNSRDSVSSADLYSMSEMVGDAAGSGSSSNNLLVSASLPSASYSSKRLHNGSLGSEDGMLTDGFSRSRSSSDVKSQSYVAHHALYPRLSNADLPSSSSSRTLPIPYSRSATTSPASSASSSPNAATLGGKVRHASIMVNQGKDSRFNYRYIPLSMIEGSGSAIGAQRAIAGPGSLHSSPTAQDAKKAGSTLTLQLNRLLNKSNQASKAKVTITNTASGGSGSPNSLVSSPSTIEVTPPGGVSAAADTASYSSDVYYAIDKEAHRAIAEYILARNLNESDLDKIKPFTTDAPVQGELDCEEDVLHRLISVSEPQYRVDAILDGAREEALRRKAAVPYPETSYTYAIIKCLSLSFPNGYIEPLFCRMALYDAYNQRKISEDFSFYLNDRHSMGMLDTQLYNRFNQLKEQYLYDEPTALFRVQDPNPDIYVVVMIDRVLYGTVEDAVKNYRSAAASSSVADKVRAKAKESCTSMCRVHQPFLFGYFKLFYRASATSTEVSEGSKNLRQLYLVPSNASGSSPFDLLSTLMSDASGMQNDPLRSEKNSIECTMKFEINSGTPDKLNDFSIAYRERVRNKVAAGIARLASAGTALPSSTYGKFAFDAHLQRYFYLVNEFPIFVQAYPALAFRNSMYIYPEYADFSSTPKFRNLALKISFKSVDKVSAPAEKRVRDPMDTGVCLSQATTSVVYHQKQPQFFDEIKLELPLHPTPTSHLLIEIFNVKTKEGKDSAKEVPVEGGEDGEAPFGSAHANRIGFAFLRLYDDHCYVPDGIYTIPVYKNLADDYLSPGVESKLERLGGKSTTVTLRTKHISTLFPRDRRSAKFFHLVNKWYDYFQYLEDPNVPEDQKYIDITFTRLEEAITNDLEALDELKDANMVELVYYTPVVINMVLKSMARLYTLCTNDDISGGEHSDDELRLKLIAKYQVPKIAAKLFEYMLFFLGNLCSVTREYGRANSLLMSYVYYFYHNLMLIPKPSYMYLLDQWVRFLEDRMMIKNEDFNPSYDWFVSEAARAGNVKHLANAVLSAEQATPDHSEHPVANGMPQALCSMDSLRFSWFFLDIIYKSIHMYMNLPEFQQYESHFNRSYVLADQELILKLQQLLKHVIPILISAVDKKEHKYLRDYAREANAEIALFLRDLIPLFGPAYVLDLVKLYFKLLSSSGKNQLPRIILKLDFLDVFCRYEEFIRLAEHDGYDVVAHQLISAVTESLAYNDTNEELRTMGLYLLKNHLIKQDYNKGLKHKRHLVADLYIPFVVNILSAYHRYHVVQLLSQSPMLLDLLVIINHILFNASESKIKEAFRLVPYSTPGSEPSEQQQKEACARLSALYELNTAVAVYLRRFPEQRLNITLVPVALRLLDNIIVQGFIVPQVDRMQALYQSIREFERDRKEREEELKRREERIKKRMDNADAPNAYAKLAALLAVKKREAAGASSEPSEPELREPTEEEERQFEAYSRELNRYIGIFDKVAYALLNTVLDSPSFDSKLLRTVIEQHVTPFVEACRPLFPMSNERKTSRLQNQGTDFGSSLASNTIDADDADSGRVPAAWNSLVSGLFLHCGLPTEYRTNSSVTRALRLLLYVYIKEEDVNVTVLASSASLSEMDDEEDEDESVNESGASGNEDTPVSYSLPADYSDSPAPESTSLPPDVVVDTPASEVQSTPRTGESPRLLSSSSMVNADPDNPQTEVGSEPNLTEDEEIEYGPNGKTVVGGTLRKLVEKLFFEDTTNPPYHKVFFLTYLSFANPFEVLAEMKKCARKLIDTGDMEDSTATPEEAEKVRLARDKRIVRFTYMFKYWIKEHYSDLDPRFLAHFIHFLDFFGMVVWRYKADRTQALLQPVQKTLCKQLVDVEMVKTTFLNKNFPDSKVPRGFTHDILNLTAQAESTYHYRLNLLEWDSMEIARQMSLVDFGVFRAIHPKELFGKLKAGETRKSPNVTAISERFNNVSAWVYSTILRTDDINMRAEYIKKFIEIGEKLRELNNFNGLNQIVSGLENNAIFRLKKTWALLAQDGWEYRLNALKKLMAHPYDEYRKALDIAVPPCCPFLGMQLTELTFINEIADFLMPKEGVRRVKMVNMHKRHLMVRTIELIKYKQYKGYDFRPLPFVVKELTSSVFVSNLGDDEAWDRSVALEPSTQTW